MKLQLITGVVLCSEDKGEVVIFWTVYLWVGHIARNSRKDVQNCIGVFVEKVIYTS